MSILPFFSQASNWHHIDEEWYIELDSIKVIGDVVYVWQMTNIPGEYKPTGEVVDSTAMLNMYSCKQKTMTSKYIKLFKDPMGTGNIVAEGRLNGEEFPVPETEIPQKIFNEVCNFVKPLSVLKYDIIQIFHTRIEDLERFVASKKKVMQVNESGKSMAFFEKKADYWTYQVNYNDGQIEGHMGENLIPFDATVDNLELLSQATQETAKYLEMFLDSGHNFDVIPKDANPFKHLTYT